MTTGTAVATRHQLDSPPDELVMRVMRDFDDLPALRLDFRQAMRLWSIDGHTCRAVLDHLISADLLERDDTGRYARVRADDWA